MMHAASWHKYSFCCWKREVKKGERSKLGVVGFASGVLKRTISCGNGREGLWLFTAHERCGEMLG